MNEMNSEQWKEMIRIAKQTVENEDDPWRTEAFKVILSKLIDSANPPRKNIDTFSIKENKQSDSLDQKKEELAAKCGITKSELENVITIHKDSIEVTYAVPGSSAHKHIVGAQIVLIAAESILELDWVPSSMLAECFRAMGVKDLANISFNLKKYPDLIRYRGTRGHKAYKLTSNMGRYSAYELIRKLAKGEFVNEN